MLFVPTKWCFTCRNCSSVGAAVPIFSSRKICRESAFITGMAKYWASSKVSAVFPTAVGPVMTMSVFNCQLSIVNYLMMPRLDDSMNEQIYSTSFMSGYLARASATPSFMIPLE